MSASPGVAPSTWLRRVLLATVAAQFALLVVRLLLELRLAGLGHPPDGGLPAVLAGLVSVAAYPVVGLVLLRKRPENRVGWLFCVAMIGWTVNNAVAAYVYLGTVAPGGVPYTDGVAWLYTWPGFVSVAFTVLLLVFFPDGGLPSPGWRHLVRLTIVAMGAAAVAASLSPGPLDASLGLYVENPLGVEGAAGPALRLINELGFPVGLLLVVAAVVSLVQRYRRSVGIERLQLKWLVSGVSLWAVTLLVFLSAAMVHPLDDLPGWGQAAQLCSVLGGAVIPVAAGVGVVRYRLYEVDRIISRTVTYAVVTLLLVGVYATGVVGVGAAARGLGVGGGDLVIAASTLAVAALFQPLRRRVQAVVDRRFNRSRYDALRTVEGFAQRLRDEVDVDVLAAEVDGVARRTLQPLHVSLWIPQEVRRP